MGVSKKLVRHITDVTQRESLPYIQRMT